jgi:putative oxidoreductase
MIGPAIAWFLKLLEMADGLLMAAGYFVKLIATITIIEHCIGIILVDAHNGRFVAGHQSGGAEYYVLINFSLSMISASDTK